MRLRSIFVTVLVCGLLGSAARAVNPPGAPDDHFLCYKAGTTKDTPKFTIVPNVTLVDGFLPTTFDVTKPTLICDPADNQSEGITNTTIHLESYKLKAVKGSVKHPPQLNVRVFNQVNPTGLVIDTKKPDLLLVPTAVDLVMPPPAPNPASHNVDLYKCYTVKLSAGQPKFPKGIQRTVGAQLTAPPKLFDIKKPKHLCFPVSKNGSVIKNAAGHLMCYQAGPARDQPKHTAVVGLQTGNEFLQAISLDTKKDVELCVPSIVNPTCGDGVKNQPSEECDGSDDALCSGQCTHLCACRQQYSFVLDPAGSKLQVRGVSPLGAGLDHDLTLTGLSGTIIFNVDGSIGFQQYEISVPVTVLPPIEVNVPGFGSLATACVFLEEDPDLPGSGLAGVGVLNCSGAPVAVTPSPNFGAHQDHCTNGSACDSGSPGQCSGALNSGGKIHTLTGECVPAAPADASCTRTDALTGTAANLEDATAEHPGVCNSPVYGVFGSNVWNTGDVVLTLNAAIEVRGPSDLCLGPPTTTPIKAPMTTGTVVSTIMDAFPSTEPVGTVQAISVTGLPFTCGPPLSTSGASLVTSAPVLDLPLPSPFGLADLNTALTLKAQ